MGQCSRELQGPWMPSCWLPGITGGGDTRLKSRRDGLGGTLREAFWVCLPGPWALRKGYLGGRVVAGQGHLATPLPCWPAMWYVRPARSCPCLSRGLLPRAGKAAGPLPPACRA